MHTNRKLLQLHPEHLIETHFNHGALEYAPRRRRRVARDMLNLERSPA